MGSKMKTPQAVRDAISRFSEAGLKTAIEENTTCCYAVQDKVWVADPEGNQWEVFVVLKSDARISEGFTVKLLRNNFPRIVNERLLLI